MMHPTYIIKKPLITEKGTWEAQNERDRGKRAGDPLNRYAVEVDMRATKQMIRAAIESLYDVKVAKVRTQVRKGKYTRTRFGPGKTANWKRATVELQAGDTIELF